MFIPLKVTPMTVAVAVLTLLIYYMQQRIPNLIEPNLFISLHFDAFLPEIYNGEYWRLISPAFLHFGLIHIAFNILFFFYLGQIIEWRFGSLHFLFIFIVLAVTANISQYITSGPFFGGLSGAVYGLLGFVWIQGEINREFGVRLPRQLIVIVLIFLVFFWFNPFAAFGVIIANTAHSAGLISGIVLALCYFVLKVRCRPIMRR